MVQVQPRNLRVNLDHVTRFMYKHCNRTLYYYYKHTEHVMIYILSIIFLVNLNTIHSAVTFLQISYYEVTWRDLYIFYVAAAIHDLHKVTICSWPILAAHAKPRFTLVATYSL